MVAQPHPSVSTPLPESDRYAGDAVFELHRGGKIEVTSSVHVRDAADLSKAYTPGVARVCTAIAEDPSLVRRYTWKSNVVAVITHPPCPAALADAR